MPIPRRMRSPASPTPTACDPAQITNMPAMISRLDGESNWTNWSFAASGI